MAAVIRGSIGGTTFSRNAAGDYVRNRTKPTYPGTQEQAVRASQMASVVDTWQGLTIAQRDAWEAKRSSNELKNKVGQSMVPSGFNLYARANLSLLITQQAVVIPPPTPLVVDAPHLGISWTDTLGIQVTTVYGWNPAYTCMVQVEFLTKQRQSINYHKGPYEHLMVRSGTFIRTVPADLLADSVLLSDTRVFLRIKVVVDNGGVSMAWWQHVDVGTIS